jgi:hypothetical protein
MKGHGSKFGRKKEAAIAALLVHRSVDDAARAICISPNTLRRWMKLPEFQAAYLEARRVATSQAVARLQQGTGSAATTMLKFMWDPSVPPACRLKAAHLVVSHALKGIETDDILVRIAALERALEAKQSQTR